MQRIPVFVEGSVSSKPNALMVSLTLAGGYMAAIEYITLDSPDTFTDYQKIIKGKTTIFQQHLIDLVSTSSLTQTMCSPLLTLSELR
jgi:hypothetical protein